VSTLNATDPESITGDMWDGWQGELAFDVGANAGQSLGQLLSRFSRVVSAEPGAEAWQLLQENFSGQAGLTCLNVAISDHDGDVALWVTPAAMAAHNLISPETWWEMPGEATHRMVPCRTLDSLAAEHGTPDLVKIDTEGHELRVLNGAPKILAEGRTGWLIEFHSQPLLNACGQTLHDAGYRDILIIRHPHYPAGSELYENHGYLRAGGA
jgi:FkbM family methyltransferase